MPHRKKALQQEGQYLTFTQGGETFALGITGIKEIIEYTDVTQVPLMPDFVRGVINLRGSVVPVIDLGARFNRSRATTTRRSCVVIIESHGQDGHPQDLGLLVDTVCAVLDIEAVNIEPSPTFGARIRVDFIAGMAKVDGRFVILLDIDKVLSIDEMAQLAGGVTADTAA